MAGAVDKLRNRLAPVPDGKCLIGLSGGADSVCLLYLLLPMIRSGRSAAEAVHINHGLRGDQSDGDEAFVRSLCAREGISLTCCRADLQGKTDENAAREARFRLFRQRMKETGAGALVLAHHADDQTETFLMRLLRGAGPEGLRCMKSDERAGGIRILRPMMNLHRGEIREALRQDGIPWREDDSNADTAYLRNRIRLELLPRLEELAPGAAERIFHTARMIGEDNDLLNAEAEALLETAADGTRLDAGMLQDQPPALLNRVLRLWWKTNAPERREHALSHSQTEALAGLVTRERGKINLPAGLHAVRCGKTIHLTGGEAPDLPPAAVSGPETRFGGYMLAITPSAGDPGDGKRCQEVPAGFTDGCVIRTRRPGDRIRPFGCSGSRKLQDYLTDRHVDEPFRDRIPLLCRGNEVLLVAGVGAGNIPGWEEGNVSVRLTWQGDMPWMK